MGLGGVPSINGAQSQPNNAASTNARSQNSASEFSLEHQGANAQNAAALVTNPHLVDNAKTKRLMKIINKRYKNRKGAPRAVLVDGEIHTVYLLAIA
jgi:hypothetical protein